MLQANPNNSFLTASPSDSGFVPRPEFARDSHVLSSFALLAIAGTASVRLSSFSHQVLASLRSTLDSQSLLRSIREEPNLNLVEFTLDGKPWTQRQNPDSEKLFVHILATIFQHGYRFLSTIDYGREQSERVSIAFSKPTTLSAHEAARTPFALSFPSSKVLRVLNPPLNSTPAILQAARSAWPRGVVSEKKVSDGCYEFRLKGYGLFQEVTFSTDSMQHILALLNALDRYAFTLLTSISLTGSHSRVKDLWIFSGSPMEPSSDQTSSNSNVDLPLGLTQTGSKNALAPVWLPSPQGNNHSADTLHGKGGSFSGSSQGSSHTLGHVRSATEPNASGLTRTTSVLRKKSPPNPLQTVPLGQSPFSRSSEEFPVRKRNLSPVGSVDMTGIGSGTQQRHFVAENVRGDAHPPIRRPNFPRLSTGSDPTSNSHLSQQERARVKTGELFYETGPATSHSQPQVSRSEDVTRDALQPRPSHDESDSGSRPSSRRLSPRNSPEPPKDVPQSVSDRATSDAATVTRPLLGSGVFRDSAFSGSTTKSCEIPITWTGPPDPEKEKDVESGAPNHISAERVSSSLETDEGYGGSTENTAVPGKRSSTPKFPGAWQPTPISEVPEDTGCLSAPENVPDGDTSSDRSPERREVDAERVASPVRSDTPEATRKSEAALYGVVPKQVQPVTGEKWRPANTPSSPSSTKPDGWVLVNIADGSTDHGVSSPSNERPKSPSQPTGPSLSPIAKAIAVQDAKKPARDKSQSVSGLRRFLSGSRSKPRQSSDAVSGTMNLSLRKRWRKKASA